MTEEDYEIARQADEEAREDREDAAQASRVFHALTCQVCAWGGECDPYEPDEEPTEAYLAHLRAVNAPAR